MKLKAKKIIAAGMCVTLLMGVTAGCGKEASDKTETGKEITFMIPDWGAPDDELLDRFKEETGITVIVNEVSWDDIRDKIAIAASGGAAVADVVEVDWSWVGEFYAADWLEPLNLSEEDMADMPTLDTFSIGDEVLAVPYANDYRLSYYNHDLFENAGVSDEPQTWNDVYEAAKTMKEAGVSEYPVSIPLNAEESAATSLMWLAYTMNGVVFNDDNTLNKESVLAALEFENKLVREELVDPADKSSSGMDAYRRILSGDAAFTTGPTSFVARSNDPEQCSVIGQIQPILVPGSEEKSPLTMPLPEAIGVTKFSENKEAAETFVKWYTSPEIQLELFEKNSTIPTHNDVLEELIEKEQIKNSGAMLEEAQRISSPFPNGIPAYYSEMSNAIYNAVNKMAQGMLTPEEAFKEMNEKVTELAGLK